MFINGEELKQIPDYPKYYAVKSGEVYRRFNKHFRKVEGTRKSNGRFRTLYIKNAKGETKRESKARLIYRTFKGEIPENKVVWYRNGYRGDCSVGNLMLVDKSKTIKTAIQGKKIAVMKTCRGSGEMSVYQSIRVAAEKNNVPEKTLQAFLSGRRPNWKAPNGDTYMYDSDFTY